MIPVAIAASGHVFKFLLESTSVDLVYFRSFFVARTAAIGPDVELWNIPVGIHILVDVAGLALQSLVDRSGKVIQDISVMRTGFVAYRAGLTVDVLHVFLSGNLARL
jgi:hypothetical protein